MDCLINRLGALFLAVGARESVDLFKGLRGAAVLFKCRAWKLKSVSNKMIAVTFLSTIRV